MVSRLFYSIVVARLGVTAIEIQDLWAKPAVWVGFGSLV